MEVELTMAPFTTDAEGNELVTFWFKAGLEGTDR
jgi:hypothetical protein